MREQIGHDSGRGGAAAVGDGRPRRRSVAGASISAVGGVVGFDEARKSRQVRLIKDKVKDIDYIDAG